MALRDWISVSGAVANAKVATSAKVDTKEARTLATLATLALAGEEKTKNQATEKVDWLKPVEDPSTCRECNRLELIDGIPGCVRRLDSGPWREEWRLLPGALDRCPKKTNYPSIERADRAPPKGVASLRLLARKPLGYLYSHTRIWKN